MIFIFPLKLWTLSFKSSLFISFIYFCVGFFAALWGFFLFFFSVCFLILFPTVTFSCIYELFYVLPFHFSYPSWLPSLLLPQCLLPPCSLCGYPLGTRSGFVFQFALQLVLFLIGWYDCFLSLLSGSLSYFLSLDCLVCLECVPLFLLSFLWSCIYHLSCKHCDPKL